MQGVRSLVEDRYPFPFHKDWHMVGKPLQLFLPNEVFIAFGKKNSSMTPLPYPILQGSRVKTKK